MKHFNIYASKDGVTKIEIFGQIGDLFFEEGNTLESVRADVGERSEDELEVDIASLGGNAFEGLAIHDLFAVHKQKVTMNMVGATASAGMVIAESADEVNISENTLALIHNSHGIAFGTAEEMEKTVSDLKAVDARMLSIFSKKAAKAGKSEEEVKTLMAEDKFIDAEEAIEFGLADNKIEASKIAASIDMDKVMASDKLSAIQKTQLQAKFNSKPMAAPKENTLIAEIKAEMTKLKDSILALGKKEPGSTDSKDIKILDNAEVQAQLTTLTNTLNVLAEANVTLETDALKSKTDMETTNTEKSALQIEKETADAKVTQLTAANELLSASKTDVPTGEDADPEDKESPVGAWGRMVLQSAIRNAK